MSQNFQYLINNLKDTILTFEFFVNWNKIDINVKKIEKQLNILNYLIGKENIREEFVSLVKEYPEVISTFPILLAIRDYKNLILLDEEGNNVNYVFNYTEINEEEIELCYKFFQRTGLERLFSEEKIKNLVDYVFGLEVGMDTNGRKNRTGTLMENLIEKHLEGLDKSRYSFISQANKNKIKSEFGIDIKIDKSSRIFDFVIYDKIDKKLFFLEVNYYSGGGSKLKSTAGEYRDVYSLIESQGHKFIWITDGMGWLTTKRPLEETYNHNNGQILNLKMLSDGELERMIRG